MSSGEMKLKMAAIFAVSLVIFSLGVVLGHAIMYGLSRGRSSRGAAGELIMSYGLAVRIVPVVCAVAGTVLMTLALSAAFGMVSLGSEEGAPLFAGIGAAVMLVLALPLTVEAFRRQVTLSEDGIAGRGWFGKAGPIPWDRVNEVTLNAALDCLVFHGRKATVYVPLLLGGRDEFARRCKKYLGKDVYGRVFKDVAHRLP